MAVERTLCIVKPDAVEKRKARNAVPGLHRHQTGEHSDGSGGLEGLLDLGLDRSDRLIGDLLGELTELLDLNRSRLCACGTSRGKRVRGSGCRGHSGGTHQRYVTNAVIDGDSVSIADIPTQL